MSFYVAGQALVVAHVLPLDVGDQQMSGGQDLVAVTRDDLLVLVVEPGDLSPGTGVHLARQQHTGAHQVQMRLLGVDDARLLVAGILLLPHQDLGGAGRVDDGAGVDGLGASASHAGVGAGLAEHVIDDVDRSHTDYGTGGILGHLVRV